MPFFTSKVTPAQQKVESRKVKGEEDSDDMSAVDAVKMFVILLHTVFRMFGGQRHPKIDSFKALKNQGLLTEYRYVPRGATLIYISHEWVGINHPDPRGDQMYHLLLLLERLLSGDIGTYLFLDILPASI